MSGIFGLLGLQDTDRSYVSTIGQRVVYDAVQKLLADYNAELNAATGMFIERRTSDHKFRYKLPGGGRLQRRGGQAPSGAVKAYGQWDVAFPLEDFGAQLAGDDVGLAYMTLQELNRHLDTIFIQDLNTLRYEIIRALVNNTQRTFVDPVWGSLLVEGLANGDAVTYPPVLGSESEATEDHYLGSAYLASAISDTNDPIATIIAELEEHFGTPTGGSNIAVLINHAQTAKVQALSKFEEVPDRFLRMGDNQNVPVGLPANMPGKVLGRHTDGAWLVEWRAFPASYMLGIHLDAPAPLIMREDPEETGLGTGLQLVAEDEQYPLKGSHYRHRFGLGAGNRLSAVVMDLSNADSDYDIPTGYS